MGNNWREILFVVDFTHPPELLPGSEEVDSFLSIKGLMSSQREEAGQSERWIYMSAIPFWYFPALLWRWSLKATLWLWWPLVLLSRPPLEGFSADQVRDHAADQVFGLQRWLLIGALAIGAWLTTDLLPDLRPWLEALSDKIQKPLALLLKMSPPPPGLRYWTLWLACVLTLILGFCRESLKIKHKPALEDETKLHQLPAERQALFNERARTLERWHTAQVVSFILLGYSVVLWLGYQHYPTDTQHLIPAWLIGYL
jgi:hypothetical protein